MDGLSSGHRTRVTIAVAVAAVIGAAMLGTYYLGSGSEQCTISAASTGFFLHLITDSTNTSITGVRVAVTPVIECGGETVAWSMEKTYTTNGSGWAVISSPGVSGDYYLIYNFVYSGHNYNLDVSWRPQSGTFTTVSLPSGLVSSAYLFPKSCSFTCTY